jgi:putative DNA primase/helicase
VTEALTDMGNARRLILQHGQDLRYCAPMGGWFVWAGCRWAKDDTGGVMRLAKDTVRRILDEAAVELDDDRRKNVANHGIRSQSEPRLRAMIKLAETEPEIVVRPDDLDADPNLFNVRNGTIDTRTGELRPHDRNDLITKMSPVEYNPDAKGPTWERFLAVVMPDVASRGYLWRAVGSALVGISIDQVLFLLHGGGANGKTTFVEMIRCVFGDYAAATDIATFMTSRADAGIRNDLARLRAARFVSAAELPPGSQFNESIVKQVTGGDKITVRYLYAEYFEYTPAFTVFLVVNQRPEVRGTDEAIWRRIRPVPFNVTIPANERDPHLIDRLRDEAPAILAWMVRGCLEWRANGLGEAPAVVEATADYRQEMDAFGQFLSTCTIDAEDTFTATSTLLDAYEGWRKHNGADPLSAKALARSLRSRGYKPDQLKHGERTRGWRGLGLSNSSERVFRKDSRTGESVGSSRRLPFGTVPTTAELTGLREELDAEVGG